MAKTRNFQVPQTVKDGTEDLSITFYIGDGIPRVIVHLAGGPHGIVNIDRPLSDYTDVTGPQKLALRNVLTAIRD